MEEQKEQTAKEPAAGAQPGFGKAAAQPAREGRTVA